MTRAIDFCLYKRNESVKDVIYGLGRVKFKYLLLLRTVKFYKRLYFKSGLLHNVFWSFTIFNRDECMRTVFIPLHSAAAAAVDDTAVKVVRQASDVQGDNVPVATTADNTAPVVHREPLPSDDETIMQIDSRVDNGKDNDNEN